MGFPSNVHRGQIPVDEEFCHGLFDEGLVRRVSGENLVRPPAAGPAWAELIVAGKSIAAPSAAAAMALSWSFSGSVPKSVSKPVSLHGVQSPG